MPRHIKGIGFLGLWILSHTVCNLDFGGVWTESMDCGTRSVSYFLFLLLL